MNTNTARARLILITLVLLAGCTQNGTPGAATPAAAQPAAQGPHTSFATPEEASDALVAALRSGDTRAVGELLGPGTADLLSSGDPVEDARERNAFLAAYDAAHSLAAGDKDNLALLVGEDRWPLPIPLVRRDGRWSFDGPAGIEEILLRRIGANELRTINVMRNYVGAQAEYAARGHDGLPPGLYAMKLNSSPGKEDGLYWETPEGKPTSPAGPFLAGAAAEGYGEKVAAAPYHGYLYRRLDAQGPDAPGGAMSYVDDGRLSKGYALLAYPASYGSGGIMSFIVSQDGTVWQKDLGEDTAKVAQGITRFNPDTSWTPLAPEG